MAPCAGGACANGAQADQLADAPGAQALVRALVEARVGQVLRQLDVLLGILQLVQHLGADKQEVALPAGRQAEAGRWKMGEG